MDQSHFKESLNQSGKISIPYFLVNFAIKGIVIGAKGITANNPKLRSFNSLFNCLFAESISSSDAVPLV
jgi:hypothetical protein